MNPTVDPRVVDVVGEIPECGVVERHLRNGRMWRSIRPVEHTKLEVDPGTDRQLTGRPPRRSLNCGPRTSCARGTRRSRLVEQRS
jgi:hypothetical protein